MNIAILGKGGREQAILKALTQSPTVQNIFVAPGGSFLPTQLVSAPNQTSSALKITTTSKTGSLQKGDGTHHPHMEYWPAYPWDKKTAQTLIQTNNIDLAIIGPEKELSEGASDFFRSLNVPVFGPSKKASQLESSKIFAKQFMSSAHIPTSDFKEVDSVSSALKASRYFDFPLVLKADGLAGGKGVFICPNPETLKEKAESLFEKKVFGTAGEKALIEPFQKGWEMSVFILTAGSAGTQSVSLDEAPIFDRALVPSLAPTEAKTAGSAGTQSGSLDGDPIFDRALVPSQILPFAKDYKKLKDNNQGPNTGGMGAFAPHFISLELKQTIEQKIVRPSLQALQKNNFFYRGVLYIGLMIVNHKDPIVLEYNVRFGDPETQVLLPLLDGDWTKVFLSVAQGHSPVLKWKKDFFSCCVVLAGEGYPEKQANPVPITGDIERASPYSYFLNAGAQHTKTGWFTKGGRVLNAIGLGSSKEEAIHRAYNQANQVRWPGMQKRSDIGS